MRLMSLLCAVGITAACMGDAPPGRYDADGEECPLTAPQAAVTLTFRDSEGVSGMELAAAFQRSIPRRQELLCTRTTAGACVVNACRIAAIDWANGPPVCGETTGGLVEVTRPAHGGVRVDSPVITPLSPAPATGEVFAVRTTGSDVPAFSTEVRLPELVTITSPEAFSTHAGLGVRAGEGFVVTWTPTASRVLVLFQSTLGDRSVECAFDGSSGRGEIPAAVLTDERAYVRVMTEALSTLRAGDFPASVRARRDTEQYTSVGRIP